MTAFEDLNLLRTFVAIVDCGSISAGARSLRVSQPALSRQLRTLEDRCGMALLRRDTHQMSLTEGGLRLLEDARTLLAQAAAADRRLHEQHTSLSGHLRLFATMDCGQFGVTRLISAFLQQHPQVTASLSLSNRPLHMIQEGADVGVLPGRITDESVVARRAGAITLHLAAAPALIKKHALPRHLQDLATWPWLSLEGSQFWSSREITLHGPGGALQTQGFSPVFTSEGVTSLREAARSGLGVSLLPSWLLEEDLRNGTLVRLLPAWQASPLPVHVVYAGHRLLPLRVSAFIDFAVKHLSENGDCRMD